MRFDVRIVDAAGRPITDLRQDEIQILEEGRPLPLVLFQRVTEPAASFVDAALRAVTAEVSSNEAFPRGHLYILIFDQQHITPGNEQRARVAAETFIRTRVRPSDRVALFAIPGPGPQIGFTADKTRALAALSTIRGSYERVSQTPYGTLSHYDAHRIVGGDQVLMSKTIDRFTQEGSGDLVGANLAGGGGRGGGAAATAEEASVVRRLIQENARAVVNQSDGESRQFLQRLADVIEQFREIEGRKTVVLFSEGFFQDNLSRELETVAAAAAQSYAVFYTFDLNRRSAPLTEAYASDTPLGPEVQARIAPLSTLAVETDGMMVIDAAARSGDALGAIADQAQDYYLVGFTPSGKARDSRGQYQRVTIRTTRPGAKVSARTGYALRDPSTSITRRGAIDSVLQSPFVQQGLKVDYTTYVMKAPGGAGHRVVLSLNAALPVRSQADEKADVVFIARDVYTGRVVASGSDTIPLPASAAEGAMGSGSWRVQFTVPAGSYVMRAVVREPGGLSGSADRRIDVKAVGTEVAVSDLVLGSALGGLPVHPRAYTGDGLSGVLESYGRTQVQLEGLDVQVELRSADGARIVTLPAELQPAVDDESGVMRKALFMLPLSTVAPGNYHVRATVRARGEIVAERTRQVEVLAGSAPAVTSTAPAPMPVSPLEITKGDLGQRYIALLVGQATGTAAQPAALHAAAGRWEETALQLQRLSPMTGFAAQALHGLTSFAREDYAGAASALTAAFAADRTSALTAFFLGWAHEGAGDPRAALSAWRSAAHLDPSLVSAHLALAEGYLRLSNPALALQAIKAGLVALPTSPELQARLAQLERGR